MEQLRPRNVAVAPRGLPAASAPAGSSPAGAGREPFLDVVRTAALLRVIIWHAFGAAAITYVVAAVPAMFFVTGSLLAKSLGRRNWRAVVFERGRRLLMPLWAFAAVAFTAMVVAHAVSGSPATRVPWRSVAFWIVPLGDPKGNAWEGGWMSSPLWYLRALVWLLILSPLLLVAVRRCAALAFAVPLAIVFLLDWVSRHPSWTIPHAPMLLWQVGDIALYGVFLMFGFLHRDGVLRRMPSLEWLSAAVGFGAAAAAWILTQPVPLHVVNNSHPAHLLVGAAWLSLALAGQDIVARVATLPITGAFLRWMNQRTMTVYLWHTTAIILTFDVLVRRDTWPAGTFEAALLVGTGCVTLLFVLVFGWVEDVATGRAPRIWPLLLDRSTPHARPSTVERHRRQIQRLVGTPALVGLLLLGVMAASIDVPRLTNGAPEAAAAADTHVSAARSKRPPVPSQAPPVARFSEAAEPVAAAPRAAIVDVDDGKPTLPAQLAPPADADFATELQQLLDDWLGAWNIPGVQVGVLRAGAVEWSGAAGIDPYSGGAVSGHDHFDIDSITKTFTATLVLQFVDDGLIDLDAPLPWLARVPLFPYSNQLTVRELLTHRSGLVNYRESARWAADPDSIDSAVAAVEASAAEPLKFEPGAQVDYSSSNYLLLGLLLEQVSGRSYDDLLRAELLDPLGLTGMTHRPSGPQEPNFSTGGIESDTTDLLRWATALYRDQLVISPAGAALMGAIDPDVSLGAGSMGYCPCTIDASGNPHFAYIGHSGGRTLLMYSPTDDLTLVINVTDSLWLEDRASATSELVDRLRTAVLTRFAPTPPEPEPELQADAATELAPDPADE
ncbi:MAG TPA: serine hydrolase [Acidimicrobiales bacterium]|nr:serine hydrolase [Acidimicrobiales bacterium]